MRALAHLVARRSGWVIVAWIVLAVALTAAGGSKLADVTTDETSSFLPKGTESTKVLDVEKDRFPGGDTRNGLIVYERDGGLTAADRARITGDVTRLKRALPRGILLSVRPPSGDLVSKDGTLAQTVITVPDDNDKIADWGKDVRRAVDSGQHGGLHVYVTSDVGVSTDFQEVFGSLDGKLLGVTVLLVLLLLGAIYRAPLIALFPILVVGFAYAVAQGLIYLYAKAGATVSTNSTSILVVLMFGVGTDYCLLLVSRYREELHRIADKREAMERAMTRVGPALLASGGTVIAAMLVLLLAHVGSIHSLGPVAAIGVASALLASITLLPALLTLAGRRGFWPRADSVACRPEEDLEQRPNVWRRFGARVLERPGIALAVTVGIFVAMSCGIFAFKEDYSATGFFKKSTESVDGFKAIESKVPAGRLGPTTVLVEPGTPAAVAEANR